VSAKPCARLWQAEAVLDGVLSRADAASFERHSATCAECTAERAALVRLASLGERMPTLEVTPLRRRALHHELLRRANEASVDARPSRFARLRVAPAMRSRHPSTPQITRQTQPIMTLLIGSVRVASTLSIM
jgi:anti-sigma factor RsiW